MTDSSEPVLPLPDSPDPESVPERADPALELVRQTFQSVVNFRSAHRMAFNAFAEAIQSEPVYIEPRYRIPIQIRGLATVRPDGSLYVPLLTRRCIAALTRPRPVPWTPKSPR